MLFRILQLVRDLEPNRHFLKLWLSQGLSLTAYNMVNFTLLIRVYDLTESSLLVSLYVLSFGIPSLFFGAIAGVVADRWQRRSVLIWTNVIRVGAVLLFLPALDSLPALYVVTFLVASVTQFFTPAEAASIPELVERKRLVAANAVFTMTMFISFILGYGLAGPLAATGSDSLPIIVAAVMFGVAALACARLPRNTTPARSVPLRRALREVRTSLRDGWQALRQGAPIRYGLAQLTVIWTIVGVVMVILPAFTGEVLGLNLREVSRVVILPIGLGMLTGGVLLHALQKRFSVRRIVTVELVIAGLALAMLGQLQMLAAAIQETWLPSVSLGNIRETVTVLLAILLGQAIATVMIASQTMLHTQTAPAMRGRVFGVLGMSINAANTVPVLLAGVLTDALRVSTTVTALGVTLAIWGAVSAGIVRHRIVDATNR